MVKRLPTMQETWVQSLGQEDPLEKEMATLPHIHAWKIPWNKEPGGLQSMGSQRVTDMTEPLHFTSLHFTSMQWSCSEGLECQTTLSASWETCIQVKKQQLDPDMEQQTGSK